MADDSAEKRPDPRASENPVTDGSETGYRKRALDAIDGRYDGTATDSEGAIGEENPPPVARYPDSWYRRGRFREEALRTLDRQIEWLGEIDTKAMRTVRFNALLLGVVVPTATFAVEFGLVGSVDAFYNVHVGSGIAALVGSTSLAGVTYTTTSLNVGVSGTDIRTAHRHGLSDRQVHDTLVTSYAEWIRSNRRMLVRNSILATATIVLMVYALALLALGAATAVLGGVPTLVRYGTYVGLGAVTLGARLF